MHGRNRLRSLAAGVVALAITVAGSGPSAAASPGPRTAGNSGNCDGGMYESYVVTLA